ncbi:MAG: hypothetical protein N3E41_08930, partial [Thermofilaceae archaeon]|nr:hypothetical protein [Thermofilaceae archaeon]
LHTDSFNSFPVAVNLKLHGNILRFYENFQFFPSCCHIVHFVAYLSSMSFFQFFPSCCTLPLMRVR